MGSIFNDHISSALFTDHIGNFIFNLHFFLFFFCNFHCLIQIRIEITNDRLPLYQSICYTVQQFFHSCCKIHIHNTWERGFHNMVYHFSQFRHIKIFIFFCHISSGNNCGNGRCIRTWASDSQFFQRFYKRCFCIMSRRLCKMLLLMKSLEIQFCILINSFYQKRIYIFLFFILYINSHKTIKFQF